MASLNRVDLIGNIGQEPELKYAPSGDAVVNLSIATSEKWTDKSGEKKEHTEWHRVVFFGRNAEVIGEYCKKGSPLYIEGKLKTRKWTDKEGAERYTTEIQGFRFQLLGSKGGGRDDDGDEERPVNRSAKQPIKKPDPDQSDFDDDIPF